jgi:hypothetical protein
MAIELLNSVTDAVGAILSGYFQFVQFSNYSEKIRCLLMSEINYSRSLVYFPGFDLAN